MTGRVFSQEVLLDIANQMNTTDKEFYIINICGDRPEVDVSRICGSLIRGSARLVDNILATDVQFLSKDFFLAHPYNYDPETMKEMDVTQGNMMEKMSALGQIAYSPIGMGTLETPLKDLRKPTLQIVKEYKLLYIYGQPKGI